MRSSTCVPVTRSSSRRCGDARSLVALAAAPAAHAQSSVTPLEFRPGGTPPPGWSFTPALDYALVWDSNVLMENVGSEIVSEQVHVLKPRASVEFVGRRTGVTLHYGGAFVQHPNLRSLNSYDQRVSAGARRALTRRTSIYANYGILKAPTTELVELVGVPFTRVGSQRQDIRSGVTTRLSRVTELGATYRFQRVDFDDTLDTLTVLNGGQSHGGSVSYKRALTSRLSLTSDYSADRATFSNGASFTVQRGWGGLEYAINADTRVFGSGGLSYLGGVDGRPSRRGPALQVGVSRDLQRAIASVTYTRAYVPSYGFGGTSDNEELRTLLRVPISRRVYTQGAVSIRRNEPLDTSDLTLRSMWFHGSVGYLLTDWVQLEAYSAGSRQNIARPDGRVNRYTVGFQITAATTTRIR
jgi:hypothetical protein